MASFDEIQQYCDTVCGQIRWKKAKPLIEKELKNHLHDQCDAYRLAGMTEDAAIHSAVQQMGDAVTVGTALDKTHRPKPQWALLALTGLLLLAGQFFSAVFSGAAQPAGFLFAAAALLCCYFLDFSLLARHSLPLYLAVLFGCFFLLLVGSPVNGIVHLSLAGFTLPLSYLALVFPLLFALLIYALRGHGLVGVLLCGLGYLPLAFLLLMVPSISGMLLFTLSALVLLCFALARGWFGCNKAVGFALVLVPTALSVLLFFLWKPAYFYNQFALLANPYAEQMGRGYLQCLVRDLLAEAQMYGTGAASAPAAVSLTLLDTLAPDYLLTLMIYRFGWAALFAVCGVFLLFTGLAGYALSRQKNMLGSLVAVAVLSTLLLQCLFYFATNLGYGLFSAFSLPFLSTGNVALVLNAALTGLMLSVFRSGSCFGDRIPKRITSRLFSYQNGNLVIHIKDSAQ